MKRILTVLAIAISLSASAQKADTTKPKALVLQGDIQAFSALMEALDKSTAPHNTIEALKTWIIGQVNPQLQTKEKAKK